MPVVWLISGCIESQMDIRTYLKCLERDCQNYKTEWSILILFANVLVFVYSFTCVLYEYNQSYCGSTPIHVAGVLAGDLTGLDFCVR